MHKGVLTKNRKNSKAINKPKDENAFKRQQT
jgi:hypothetical protein